MKTLSEYRNSLNLTQSQFGQRLGVSGAMIGLWERGDRTPSGSTLIRIADEFAINLQVSKDGIHVIDDNELPPAPKRFECTGDDKTHVVISCDEPFTAGEAVSWFYFTYQRDYLLEKDEEKEIPGWGHSMKFKIK